MGYQQRIRSPRASGRGGGSPRREKAKARGRKHRPSYSSLWEESHVSTMEEIVSRTLSRLRNLGSQRFAFSPYGEHFDRWLVDLKDVLSEFESSPTINADDQFVKERAQILSNVERELEEKRRKEASFKEAHKSMSEYKVLLERIEEEYASRVRQIKGQKNSDIRRLQGKIDSLRRELDDLAQTKAGLFRAMSKKAKAQRETEAAQSLSAAQKELALAAQRFAEEQERLRDEYERKKQPVVEQIRDREKQIEDLEIDGSLENRQVACEALATEVSALLRRKTSEGHQAT